MSNYTNIREFKKFFNLLEKDIQEIMGRVGDKYGLSVIIPTDYGEIITQEETYNAIVDYYSSIIKRVPSLYSMINNPTPCVPVASSKYVYFLIDGDTVVYVGMTVNLISRLASHINDSGKKFTSVYYVEDEDNETLEAFSIRQFLPKYNVNMMKDKTFFYHCVDRVVRKL
jgi:hypothetical protein